MAKISIPEIAKLAGVSIGTVDRALHNRPGINPQTRDKVLRIAAAHHYRPNKLSKALSNKRKFHFVVITLPTQSPFTRDVIAAARKTAAELEDFGVKVTIDSLAEISAALEVQKIQHYLKEKVDGFALEGIDKPELVRMVDMAVQRGVPVVTFNTDLAASKRLCYVGQDNFKSGKVAADLLCRFIDKNGEILILHGSKQVAAHQARVDGFCSQVVSDFPDARVAGIVETKDNEITAYHKTIEFLSAHRRVKGIYVAATGSRGAADALRRLKLAGRVSLVCNDIVPKTIDYLQRGIIDATLLQDPQQQGEKPLRILFDYLFENKLPEKTLLYTPIDILTKSGL